MEKGWKFRMKKQRPIFILIGVFIIILFTGLISIRQLRKERVPDESKTVFIKKTEKGYQLFRKGTPFYIQGASGDSHFRELTAIGGNTIRIFDTINIGNILNEALENNLAVIVDIPLPKFTKNYNFYIDDQNTTQLKQRVKALVKKYNHHQALLMWNLGNEIRYPIVLARARIMNSFNKSNYFQENQFIKVYNELLDMIHSEDPNHPVCTTLIATDDRKVPASIYLNSPKIDLISFNIFGRIKDYKYSSTIINLLFGDKPYYLSEWGSDGHWECEITAWKAPIEPTSAKKAEQVKSRNQIMNERMDGSCLGNLVFYWGQKQEITHTWFSIFDDQGRKSQTYYELQHIWGNTTPHNFSAPPIRYMLIGKKGARDNLVFYPNEIRNAQIFLDGEPDSTLQFNWEIYEEGWNYYGANAKQKRPNRISGCFVDANDSVVSFRVPSIEGPYRIFAYVYDKNGNFATTNAPFYVLDNK